MSLRVGKITRTQVFNVGTGQGGKERVALSLFSSEFVGSKVKRMVLAGKINPTDTYPVRLVGWFFFITELPPPSSSLLPVSLPRPCSLSGSLFLGF